MDDFASKLDALADQIAQEKAAQEAAAQRERDVTQTFEQQAQEKIRASFEPAIDTLLPRLESLGFEYVRSEFDYSGYSLWVRPLEGPLTTSQFGVFTGHPSEGIRLAWNTDYDRAEKRFSIEDLNTHQAQNALMAFVNALRPQK